MCFFCQKVGAWLVGAFQSLEPLHVPSHVPKSVQTMQQKDSPAVSCSNDQDSHCSPFPGEEKIVLT